MRRIQAIATSKGVDPGQLAHRLRLCFRVPRLAAPGAGSELATIQAELAEHPAVLVVLDPLYLAPPGPADPTCTTWRRPPSHPRRLPTRRVRPAGRHPLEQDRGWPRRRPHQRRWPGRLARVICSVSVHYRGSDPDLASSVVLGVELIGGEIADTHFRIRRRVRSEDAADLGAPLTYAVEVLAADEDQDLEPAAAALSKSRQWVLMAVRTAGTCRRSSSWGIGWPRPAIHSGPAPSRPPSAR